MIPEAKRENGNTRYNVVRAYKSSSGNRAWPFKQEIALARKDRLEREANKSGKGKKAHE